MPSSRTATIAFFVALLASAPVLGPALAHLLELPNNWERLRRQWEYSHAAGAAFQLVGICLLTFAVVSRRRG
jgi:hypothetical protein